MISGNNPFHPPAPQPPRTLPATFEEFHDRFQAAYAMARCILGRPPARCEISLALGVAAANLMRPGGPSPFGDAGLLMYETCEASGRPWPILITDRLTGLQMEFLP